MQNHAPPSPSSEGSDIESHVPTGPPSEESDTERHIQSNGFVLGSRDFELRRALRRHIVSPRCTGKVLTNRSSQAISKQTLSQCKITKSKGQNNA